MKKQGGFSSRKKTFHKKRFAEKKQEPGVVKTSAAPGVKFPGVGGGRGRKLSSPDKISVGGDARESAFFRILKGHQTEPLDLIPIDRSFQQKTIEAIHMGKDILLSAPLGAGKTYIVYEMAKIQVVYLAVPTKALANNVYAAAKSHNIPCKLTTGDFELEDPDYRLVVGTAEKISQLDCKKQLVFIDEASWIFDEDRGIPTYLDFMKTKPDNQFILMSGTIQEENVQNIFKRITGRELHLVKSQSAAVVHFFNPYVPRSAEEWGAIPKPSIVFCDDKLRSQRLVDELGSMGFRVCLHHSSLNLLEKVKNEIRFGMGEVDFLVGTSGIAFGINTPTQSVVLYDTGSSTNTTITQILGRAGRPGFWARGYAFGAKSSPDLNRGKTPLMFLGVRERCFAKEQFWKLCDYWQGIVEGIAQVDRRSWDGRIDLQYLQFTENDVPIEIQETVFDLIKANKPVYAPKLLQGRSYANDSTTLRWLEKLAGQKTVGIILGVEEAQLHFERKWKVQAAMKFLSDHYRNQVEQPKTS